MASSLATWVTSALVFILGVGILSRLLSDKQTPGLVSNSLSVLTNLFHNTVKGK